MQLGDASTSPNTRWHLRRHRKSVQHMKEIMSPDESVNPGQLVRYLQTTTRWQFARVRHVDEEEIELSFFDGTAPIKVPRTQVETLETFFDGRKRVGLGRVPS